MGVPSFYRWLVSKYPNIRVDAITIEGEGDTSSPNGNGMEFDNLYLDMNAIIHPCFHPEDQSMAPTTYEDVFNRIYEYIDNLFNIVRPRKLLYMAIDGVAPRAKLNQQRARRFQTAKDYEIAEDEEDRLRKKFEMEGKPVLPKVKSEVDDSIVITPGTEFMCRLSKKLNGYIKLRLNSNPGWKEIQVILSDSNVPGEGEHKIMCFVRSQRSMPGYNPNTRHCLYGLDADLIMLALATHEIHFSILREDVLKQVVAESYSSKSRGWFKDDKTKDGCLKDSNTANTYAPRAKTPYEFLQVWILREYLELDMKIEEAPEKFIFDLERIIDDFIFICFFAGNDFLPHMPTLEIHEGAIDLLMTVYKEQLKNNGGYLVDMQKVQDKKGGYVKLKRVEKFILMVGTYEEEIFKKRSELHERRLRRLCQHTDSLQDEDIEIGSSVLLSAEECTSRGMCKNSSADDDELLRNTKELKQKLKENLRKKSDLLTSGNIGADKVKLGMKNWKQRYYKHKFSAETSHQMGMTRKNIVEKYTEGLLWVLQYYFNGIPSWSWYYPYHHGPFASDLKGLSSVRAKFRLGRPFKPFDQQLSVLPPRSAQALPKPYLKLITDEDSKIIDFYPTDFEVDTDGKRYTWQGICKLPFIDEQRLTAESRRVDEELTQEECERNVEKNDLLFVRRSSKIGTKISALVLNTHTEEKLSVNADMSGAIGGLIWNHGSDNSDSTLGTISLLFELPDGKLHIPRPLQGVAYPSKEINEDDIQMTPLWHTYPGTRPPYNNRQQSQPKFPWSSDSECGQKHINSCRKLSAETNEIHKVVGTGWGGGRGKTACDMEKGIANLKIPQSSLNSRSYGRGQTPSNAFWPSRTNDSYGRGQTPSNAFWPSRTNASSSTHNMNTWRRHSLQNSTNSSSKGVWELKTGGYSPWKLNPANGGQF